MFFPISVLLFAPSAEIFIRNRKPEMKRARKANFLLKVFVSVSVSEDSHRKSSVIVAVRERPQPPFLCCKLQLLLVRANDVTKQFERAEVVSTCHSHG